MANRIATAIAVTQDRLDKGVKPDGSPITADLVAFEKSMDNTITEHFSFQNAQVRAHASGKITADEARVIYNALGEVPSANGWAEGTSLATKVVVTQVVSELLRVRR